MTSFTLRHPRAAAAAGVFAAGAVQAMTFAPGPLPDGALAIVQVLMLAVLARRQLTAPTWRRALWEGWLYNFACYALGLYWLYVSMHYYGGLTPPLAAAGVLALSAFLALFPASAGVLARWLQPLTPGATPGRRLRSALAFACAWTALEWVRGTLWTGFPWLNIGYAQVDSPFAGWAPIVGVYGVAWLAAFAAAALAALWRPADAPRDPRHAMAAALAAIAALAGWGASHVRWSHPEGAALQVRLIQGNIEQSQKFDPGLMERGLLQHMNQASMPPQPGMPAPRVIILPETVLPVFQDQLAPGAWDVWRRIAAERDATIVMGVPLHRRLDGVDRYTNSAIAFDGNTPVEALRSGEVPRRYDKYHLVPWGEFVPPGFHWFVRMLDIPLGDFDRGDPRQPPFDIDGQRLALNICYEDLFGEELLPAVRPGANGEPGASILVNISNLGWFGDTWALRQHLQIARMRALETARPLLAATNTGITASIDPQGRVVAQLPTMQATSLQTAVQGMTGLTPYTRTGNAAVMGLVAAGLLLLAASRAAAARQMARAAS
ncbi:apolipoprotein N-acyltransferase [Bordetella genomosp. 9]|uniref:apolipoprotein N-acyltransferase n=1 Tax=Bordetella genomosp. 9 TaxID=1416803 RepID=UPI000A29333D|nr:apolipoprotein N-acyltransferase [Bordetella genomosp. 9]ARP91771.1 apolipoprotein N-acyltransferase [Bordetella genomosp. 9]